MHRRLQPFLEQISDATGESSSAAVMDGDEIVYIARSTTRRIMSIGLGIGSRLPVHCTSLGRALLACQPDADIVSYLDRAQLDRRTRFTITGKRRLMAELRRVSEQGYAVVNEELEIGLRSIAVPIRGQSGIASVALNASAQAARVSPQ